MSNTRQNHFRSRKFSLSTTLHATLPFGVISSKTVRQLNLISPRFRDPCDLGSASLHYCIILTPTPCVSKPRRDSVSCSNHHVGYMYQVQSCFFLQLRVYLIHLCNQLKQYQAFFVTHVSEQLAFHQIVYMYASLNCT